MISFAPSFDPETGAANLAGLLNSSIDKHLFEDAIRNLNKRFKIYSTTFPASLIAPDLIVTPETRLQSEIYLPISEIRRIFYRLYRHALCYPPVLSSTPFHKALSWADVFVALPQDFQFSVNPAKLLESLLSDLGMLTDFLFHSFLPRRFYGGFSRYPGQTKFIREWLGKKRADCCTRFRFLDAACGTGEDTYNLANLCINAGFYSDEIKIEGWTLDPLEVWVAAHQSIPHYNQSEPALREEASKLFERGFQSSLTFRCADLTESEFKSLFLDMETADSNKFDLILCNGLLGGPIINKTKHLEQVVANLASLLAPGGLLLAANCFHDGWKLKFGDNQLKTLFKIIGLEDLPIAEGIGCIKI